MTKSDQLLFFMSHNVSDSILYEGTYFRDPLNQYIYYIKNKGDYEGLKYEAWATSYRYYDSYPTDWAGDCVWTKEDAIKWCVNHWLKTHHDS